MLNKFFSIICIISIQISLSAFSWRDLFVSRTVIRGNIENSVINIDVNGVTILSSNGSITLTNDCTYFTLDKDGVIQINNYIIPVKTGDRVELSGDTILINGKAAEIKKLSGETIKTPLELSIDQVSVPVSIARVYAGDKSYIECDSAVNDQIDFSVSKGKLSATVKNNQTAYEFNGKAKSLCTVYAKILADSIKANNFSHVSMDNQPVKQIRATDHAAIDGTISSDIANISVDSFASADIEGQAPTVDLNSTKHSSITYKNINSNLGKTLKARAENFGTIHIHDQSTYREWIALKADQHSTINADNLNTPTLRAKLDQFSKIETSGSAESQTIQMDQHSSYRASKLKSQMARIYATQFAQAKLNAKNITGNASEFSKVRYARGAKAKVLCDQFSSCQQY